MVPLGMRESIRHRIGPFAPWEHGFSPVAPVVPAGQTTGPPDFVGIGVQKAGTTWWFEMIGAHPGVHLPDHLHKERHFFGRFALEPFDASEVERYRAWFPRPPGAVTGEWTPDYMSQPWTAPLLAEAAPGTRLLVLLRDPVERFLSGVAHDGLRGGSRAGAVVSEAFDRGRYAAALEPWAGHFPAERLLVLQYERCVADPAHELERTWRFLGLPAAAVPDDLRRPVSPSEQKPALSADARRRLAELYAPDVEQLVARYPEIDLRLWPNFGGG